MYTDGILEASNAEGEFYGHVALCDLVTRTRHLSPAMAADSIIFSVRQWAAKQNDDLTVLICDYTPRVDECGVTALSLRAGSMGSDRSGVTGCRQGRPCPITSTV